MDKVKVIFGSTSGNTKRAAQQIAAAFGVEPIDVANATSVDFEAELLILGSSTWGLGELQDDWYAGLEKLAAADLAGRKVAVFGLGDQNGFGDTFCDAMGIIMQKALERGATPVGDTPVDGSSHTGSAAEANGSFCGLALDDDNEPGKSAGRITAWCKQLQI